MMLWMVLFWAAVIVGVVWLVASLKGRDSGGAALEVLRGRLASGEIDVDEFCQREVALKGSTGERDTLMFDSPGDYDYYCSIHPSMKARLVVR